MSAPFASKWATTGPPGEHTLPTRYCDGPCGLSMPDDGRHTVCATCTYGVGFSRTSEGARRAVEEHAQRQERLRIARQRRRGVEVVRDRGGRL